MRIGCLPLKTREPPRAATGAWHNPNVVCVSKSDLSCADSRSSQQSSLTSVSVLGSGFLGQNQKTGDEYNDQREAAEHVMCPPDGGLKCAVSIISQATKRHKKHNQCYVLLCGLILQFRYMILLPQTKYRGERP